MIHRILEKGLAVRLIGARMAPHDDTGATAVEYGLMVAFIAAFIVAAVTTFGLAVTGTFESFTGQWP